MFGRYLYPWLIVLATLLPAAAELPFAEHGWTKDEAAAHLLSRFTYGPRPGEVTEVSQMGLESWLNLQLQAKDSDRVLQARLAELPPAYALTNSELLETYPRPAQLRRMAESEGLIQEGERPDRQAVLELLKEKGMRPYHEIGLTLFAQRLLHARHSENAVREVMTDFWFNHFNVAVSNNQARPFILSYERDVIRPNSLGRFRILLGATAKHPAMLLYLDNANSSASSESMTTVESRMKSAPARRTENLKKRIRKRKKGLNENYARELMELHTLGVDGGYTQEDVVEVARAFTGWTTLGRRARQKERTEKQKMMQEAMGIRQEGDFRFAAAIHDAEAKTVLGKRFPAGGGIEEGERVLDLLSEHPSTANHLAHKLAVRFICDQPDPRDVDKIARAFKNSGGDIKATVRAIVETDGFWDKKNRHAKVKSPFEYVVSANRALDGELYPSRQLYGWMAKMGQPLYNYQAPTGFPDNAEFWVSSATVLNRVNFALQAATGGVSGFLYTPQDSPDLHTAVKSLLLYRDDVADTETSVRSMLEDSKDLKMEPVVRFEVRPNLGGQMAGTYIPILSLQANQKDTATMIGLILGTPEFQRR